MPSFQTSDGAISALNALHLTHEEYQTKPFRDANICSILAFVHRKKVERIMTTKNHKFDVYIRYEMKIVC